MLFWEETHSLTLICYFIHRLYSNQITDVGAKLVAQIIEECPKLRVVKYVSNLYQKKSINTNYSNNKSYIAWSYIC